MRSYSDVPVAASEVAFKAARSASGRTRKAEMRKYYEFIYHPRVSETDLRGGWMQRLDDLQGRRSTFHAGGLFTFWVRFPPRLQRPCTH